MRRNIYNSTKQNLRLKIIFLYNVSIRIFVNHCLILWPPPYKIVPLTIYSTIFIICIVMLVNT